MAFLLPQGVAAAGQMGIPQQQAVNEPFVWGQGGERLTPEDIAMQRALGQRQAEAGADFSPATGGFLEALGRGGQGLLGGLQQRRAAEAADVNAAETDAVLQALMGKGVDNATLMSAMANPYVSDQARQLAQFQFERANPKPQAPGATEMNYNLIARRLGVKAADRYLGQLGDEMITTSLPGGNFYAGPQSGLAEMLRGAGAQGGTPPQAPVGKLTPYTGGGSGNATGGF